MEKRQDRIKERDRLGRLVRELWVSWAERHPNPKQSWLVPYDELTESDKEADRVIGEGMMVEFFAATTGERCKHERLMQLAVNLRDTLHGFVVLFDEDDPVGNEAIREFDEFVSGK
jgi:hypothetical protein